MFHTLPLGLPGLLQITPDTVMDRHGWVSAVHNERLLATAGIHSRFVDTRIHYADKAGTVRGPRFVAAPGGQALLLRSLRGGFVVVAIDIRRSAPTFGRHELVKLTYANARQLFVAPGFAVGWCSLQPASELLVMASAEPGGATERGINWRDPALAIAWPVRPADAIVLASDIDQPMLAEQTDLPA